MKKHFYKLLYPIIGSLVLSISSCDFISNIFDNSEDETKEDDDSDKINTDYVKKDNLKVPVQSIHIEPKTLDINLGDVRKLTYSILPTDATDQNVTFESSNPDVLSVDNEGIIKGLKEGTSLVVVKTTNNKRDIATINVSNFYTINSISITNKNDSISLYESETYQIHATYSPSIFNINLSYESSDINVATVDENGLVSAKSDGYAKITAYYDSNNNNQYNNGEPFDYIMVNVKRLFLLTPHNVRVYPLDFFSNSPTIDNLDSVINNINVYEIEGHGKIPYIKIEDFIKLIKVTNPSVGNNLSTNIENDKYMVTDNKVKFIFDNANEKIIVQNYHSFLNTLPNQISMNNNTIDGAPIHFGDYTPGITDPNTSSILKDAEDIVLDLKSFGLNFFKQIDFLIPLHSIIDLITPTDKSLIYTGDSLFSSYATGNPYYSYLFSGIDSFRMNVGSYFESYGRSYICTYRLTQTGEKNVKYFYTYADSFSDTGNIITSCLRFYENGTGNVLYKYRASSLTDFSNSGNDIEINSTFNYDDTTYPGVIVITNSNGKKSYININCPNTLANVETIPEGLNEHNYNILRYKFKYFYGLDEYHDKDVDYFFKNNNVTIHLDTPEATNTSKPKKSTTGKYYDLLMNNNSMTIYFRILCNFLNEYCNDAHTRPQYGPAMGHYDDYIYTRGMNLIGNSESASIIYTKQNSHSNYRDKYFKITKDSPYFFITNNTAVLCLDSFTSYLTPRRNDGKNTKNFYNYTIFNSQGSGFQQLKYYDGIPAIWMIYSFFGEIYFAYKNQVKNIVIDVSQNTGGKLQGPLMALAFYSDKTNFVFENKLTKRIVSYNYNVVTSGDANARNHFKNNTKLYVLTSEATFSAANIFAGMVKTTGVGKIIGKDTSGGACSTLMETDAFGSFFYRSGINMVYGYDYNSTSTNYKDKMIDIEKGVSVDYKISDIDMFYDHERLDNYLNTLS